MIVSSTWVNISAGECLVTKNGTNLLKLAYASSSPTTEATVGVSTNLPQRFPLITGKSLWAQAAKEDVSITVDIL